MLKKQAPDNGHTINITKDYSVDYEQVLKSLERMDKKWHINEEYWILRIRYYVELKQGKELKETLEQIQQEHIYLSAKGKEALAFWQE